ncbi:34_t:CDS:2, partial [Cetraspora pellucida]
AEPKSIPTFEDDNLDDISTSEDDLDYVLTSEDDHSDSILSGAEDMSHPSLLLSSQLLDCVETVSMKTQNDEKFLQELITLGMETPPSTVILPWSCDTI